MSVTPVRVQKKPHDREIAPSELFLVPEKLAARLCAVSLPTFRQWIAAGLLRPIELPGGIRRNLYRRADIEQFIASRPSK